MSSGSRATFATDAEVIELVADAIGVELHEHLDRRRLRRLNSAVGRYRLARRAAARRGTRERVTTRRQIAAALYGPEVELADVLRQIKRIEADLAAAGLLDVEIVSKGAGRPVGVRERLLDVPPVRTGRTRHALCRRPESRRERLARRHGPWRRQQSDRAPRGGVPGLYVRRRDLDPRNCQCKGPRWLYGTTSLEPASDLTDERDAPERAPGPERQRRARERMTGTIETRADERAEPRGRFAALSRLRTAGTERTGPDRLRAAARGGAPPCSVAIAAFEGRFVIDGPWSWGVWQDGRPVMLLDGYRPIGARWALRLERWCALHDRQTGELGSGLVSLIDDVLAWEPEHGAPRGGRFDDVDLRDLSDPTRHVNDPGYPASLAYFIARLGVRAKALRRANDAERRHRSIDWRSTMRPPGPDPQQSARYQRLGDELADELDD